MSFKIPTAEPVFRSDITSSCFCLSLRNGLIACAYCKLITVVLLLCFVLITLCEVIALSSDYESLTPQVLLNGILLALLLTDVVLHSIFIEQTRKKELRLLKICVIYSIVLWVVSALIILTSAGFIVHTLFGYYFSSFSLVVLVSTTIISMVYFVVQSYFLLLLRSEVGKHNNVGNTLKLVKNTAETEFTMNIGYVDYSNKLDAYDETL